MCFPCCSAPPPAHIQPFRPIGIAAPAHPALTPLPSKSDAPTSPKPEVRFPIRDEIHPTRPQFSLGSGNEAFQSGIGTPLHESPRAIHPLRSRETAPSSPVAASSAASPSLRSRVVPYNTSIIGSIESAIKDFEETTEKVRTLFRETILRIPCGERIARKDELGPHIDLFQKMEVENTAVLRDKLEKIAKTLHSNRLPKKYQETFEKISKIAASCIDALKNFAETIEAFDHALTWEHGVSADLDAIVIPQSVRDFALQMLEKGIDRRSSTSKTLVGGLSSLSSVEVFSPSSPAENPLSYIAKKPTSRNELEKQISDFKAKKKSEKQIKTFTQQVEAKRETEIASLIQEIAAYSFISRLHVAPRIFYARMVERHDILELGIERMETTFLSEYYKISKNTLPTLQVDFRSVLEHLSTLHKHGIVHSDIKLDNVLKDVKEGKASVKLCDFGLTGSVGNKCMGGTKLYEDPLYIHGKDDLLHPSIDIWAFGTMLFEAYFHSPLFSKKFVMSEESLSQTAIDTHLTAALLEKPRVRGSSEYSTEHLADLLGRIFILNREERISAEDALKHPFFTEELGVGASASASSSVC